MTQVASTRAVTLERYRALRESVRERHRTVLNAQASTATPTAAVRNSAAWKSAFEEAAERKLGPNYIQEEETIRNDYSQHYVDSGCGLLPGTAVRNPGIENRFSEYPKLRKLIQAHSELVAHNAHAPTYLNVDLAQSLNEAQRYDPAIETGEYFHLSHLLPIKYDVVLIDPPLECYQWEALPMATSLRADPSESRKDGTAVWSWDDLAQLPIPQLAAKESFIFLWVGSGARNGLERGRELLSRWGFRRCEDICWLAVDEDGHDEKGSNKISSTSSGLTRTVQHCLVGIRGTVRRSKDTNFVHCNIDTDAILWPPEQGLDRLISKPPELYHLIENFCLGTRRIELFGRNRNLRRGWLTVGSQVGPEFAGWEDSHERDAVAYSKTTYDSHFRVDPPGCDLRDRQNVVPYSAETDALRPKSPPPRHAAHAQHGSPGELLAPGMLDGRGWSPAHSPGMNGAASLPGLQYSPSGRLGGAGLSGLGAGGPQTVSVPSGSETLSGPQASVLGLRGAHPRSGPSGLGRSMH